MPCSCVHQYRIDEDARYFCFRPDPTLRLSRGLVQLLRLVWFLGRPGVVSARPKCTTVSISVSTFRHLAMVLWSILLSYV